MIDNTYTQEDLFRILKKAQDKISLLEAEKLLLETENVQLKNKVGAVERALKRPIDSTEFGMDYEYTTDQLLFMGAQKVRRIVSDALKGK